MLQGADKLAVALSGGKDSLTLLFMLKAILGRGLPNPPLVAIHVDGAFSCGASLEKQFLTSICQKMDIPLVIRSSEKKNHPLQCYSCARERRKILFQAAKEMGCSHIAFGHHKDDAAATLLLNLLHKAEFASMMPKVHMERYGVTILRPLFYVEEEEIKRFAQMHQFQRISCKCPVGQRSKRKASRDIITFMERHFPHAKTNLFQAGEEFGSKKALTP